MSDGDETERAREGDSERSEIESTIRASARRSNSSDGLLDDAEIGTDRVSFHQSTALRHAHLARTAAPARPRTALAPLEEDDDRARSELAHALGDLVDVGRLGKAELLVLLGRLLAVARGRRDGRRDLLGLGRRGRERALAGPRAVGAARLGALGLLVARVALLGRGRAGGRGRGGELGLDLALAGRDVDGARGAERRGARRGGRRRLGRGRRGRGGGRAGRELERATGRGVCGRARARARGTRARSKASARQLDESVLKGEGERKRDAPPPGAPYGPRLSCGAPPASGPLRSQLCSSARLGSRSLNMRRGDGSDGANLPPRIGPSRSTSSCIGGRPARSYDEKPGPPLMPPPARRSGMGADGVNLPPRIGPSRSTSSAPAPKPPVRGAPKPPLRPPRLGRGPVRSQVDASSARPKRASRASATPTRMARPWRSAPVAVRAFLRSSTVANST